MDLAKLPLFAMASKRMAWLARRQEVLSQNVANADTPAFVPHDLKPQDFRSVLKATQPTQVAMARTDSAHIPARQEAAAKFRDTAAKETFEEAPSGNAVVLEEQLMKVSETQTDFRMATSLYHKHIAMIKDALGRRGG
jgi:flagellar basal-body rod protein FlgB